MYFRLFLGAVALSACATVVDHPATVDDTYASAGSRWSSGASQLIAFKLVNRGGVALVCGVRALNTNGTSNSDRAHDVFIKRASIYHGDDRLVTGLSFFPRLNSRAKVQGARAACVDTGEAWREEFGASPPRLVGPRSVQYEG